MDIVINEYYGYVTTELNETLRELNVSPMDYTNLEDVMEPIKGVETVEAKSKIMNTVFHYYAENGMYVEPFQFHVQHVVDALNNTAA